MATLTQVELVDDLDGSQADTTVTFSLNGVAWEIDLSELNAKTLEGALEPFMTHGRRIKGSIVRGRVPTVKAKSAANGPASTEVRAWAERNGVPVSARGRIPQSIIAQYEEAQRAPAAEPETTAAAPTRKPRRSRARQS